MKSNIFILTFVALFASSGATDYIHCKWDTDFWDEDLELGPEEACEYLDDEHTEPYLCDGRFEHICCTVSGIDEPEFETFGKCYRFESDRTGLSGTRTIPTDEVDEVDFIEDDMITAEDEDFEQGVLKCIEPLNKLKRMSIRRACRQLGQYKKPYRCDYGQELCCTPSRISETDFQKPDEYGLCSKLGL